MNSRTKGSCKGENELWSFQTKQGAYEDTFDQASGSWLFVSADIRAKHTKFQCETSAIDIIVLTTLNKFMK